MRVEPGQQSGSSSGRYEPPIDTEAMSANRAGSSTAPMTSMLTGAPVASMCSASAAEHLAALRQVDAADHGNAGLAVRIRAPG